MTGPDHYRQAEQWADHAATWYRKSDEDTEAMEAGQLCADLAQAHATLALAAATALSQSGEMYVPDAEAWETAASGYERTAPEPNPSTTEAGA